MRRNALRAIGALRRGDAGYGLETLLALTVGIDADHLLLPVAAVMAAVGVEAWRDEWPADQYQRGPQAGCKSRWVGVTGRRMLSMCLVPARRTDNGAERLGW